jgi:hypothetical protein
VVRSSKPSRRVRPFRLILTRGGGAELIDVDDDEAVVWSSADDEDFREEFDGFLNQEDTYDILDYLEQVGELTRHEADQCDVREEYYSPSDLIGMFR